MSTVMPDSASILSSLAAAADAARQAYMAALAANPGQDLSAIYAQEMAALNAWSSATAKALGANPAVKTAQVALDAATNGIRGDLATVKAVATWVTRLDNLVQLAAKVAAYFV